MSSRVVCRVASLLLAAASCVSAPRPGRAADSPDSPVTPAAGFRYAERLRFAPSAALGGLDYSPDGEIIVYENESGEIRVHAPGGPRTLTRFEPAVFGSFIVLAPGGGAVVFSESTEHNVYRVPIDGGERVLLDHIRYAFDLAFDADGRGFVSAPGQSGGNSIRLLDSEPESESKEVVVNIPLYSGPVAFDGGGSLYYATSNPGAEEGQSILRFPGDLLDSALEGNPLDASDGEVVATGLNHSIYGMRLEGGKFLITDLGFTTGTGALYSLDPSAGYEESLVATFQLPAGLLSPSYVAFRPGTRQFAPGAGPAGGSITVAFSDFSTIVAVGEIVPELHFVRGRVNGDAAVDIADAVALLAYLFSGGDAPEIPEASDVNDDGTVDLSDPIYLLDYLFKGGPAVPPPFPEAGPDA